VIQLHLFLAPLRCGANRLSGLVERLSKHEAEGVTKGDPNARAIDPLKKSCGHSFLF